MNDDIKSKLGLKEYRDLTIQSGLQLIPGIGSALSSAYFGYKQEIRFKRIEEFYKDLAKRVEELGDRIELIIVDENNKETIISMIEQMNDEIEKISQQSKKQFFINYFINYMDKNKRDIHHFRGLYFQILKELNYSHLMKLKDLYNEGPSNGISLTFDNFRASAYSLMNYGLIKQEGVKPPQRTGDSYFPNPYRIYEGIEFRISNLGRRFHDFCLRD